MNSILTILMPVVLTAVLAAVIRAAGGAERGSQLAGIAVPLGFIVSWGVLLTPGWSPGDAFSRMGHIAAWGALVGMVLDVLGLNRVWAAVAAGAVVLVSVWASVNDGLTAGVPMTVMLAGSVLILSLAAFLFIARLDRLKERPSALFVTMGMVSATLAIQGAIVGDADMASSALTLTLAIAAFAAVQATASLRAGDGLILGTGVTILALAWALAVRDPAVRLGLVLVPLILFAEGTAKHIPLPAARISAFLYPIVLALVAALPLILGALITFVMFGP